MRFLGIITSILAFTALSTWAIVDVFHPWLEHRREAAIEAHLDQIEHLCKNYLPPTVALCTDPDRARAYARKVAAE